MVIVLGIMAASGLFAVEKSERSIGAGARLALLTTVFWGLAYPLLGQAIDVAGWEAVTLIQLIAMVPVLGVMLLFRRTQEGLTATLVRRSLRSPYIIAAGVLHMLAVLAINVGFGLDQTAGTMVVTTSAAYPVITMLLALRHFDEHADKLTLMGAAPPSPEWLPCTRSDACRRDGCQADRTDGPGAELRGRSCACG